MKALVYKEKGHIELIDKSVPKITDTRDAIVKVKLSSICTSDLHIINGAVPAAKKDIVLGHEFVGEIVKIGSSIQNLKVGDRVSANCETFCGECYFCQKGYINNCINGGWMLGCKINGCQAEYVRVPFADKGLTKIPDNVSYENALFVGDILSSGYFSAEMCEIKGGETIAVIGAGPVGLCAMQCAKLMGAKKIIAIDINDYRLNIAKKENLADIIINSSTENCDDIVAKNTNTYGADGVIEAAGSDETFRMAWKIARPNGIVAIVAMYEKNQILPLPQMYGKNLIFKTGGVDAIHCEKLLNYISIGKLNTDFLISKTIDLDNIINAYNLFSEKNNDILKIAIKQN